MKAMSLDRYTKTLLIPEEELMTALNASVESNDLKNGRGTAFAEGKEEEEQEIQVGGRTVNNQVIGGVSVAGSKKRAP